MTTYNPYQSQERHRRAKPKGMTAAEYLRCMGVALATIALLLIAAIL
jgi:hypothetical protein